MPFITQGKTNWKFLLIVVILAAVIGGGILWWNHSNPIPICGTPLLPKQYETADWQTYRNEEYGFEVKYPVTFDSTKLTLTFKQHTPPQGTDLLINDKMSVSDGDIALLSLSFNVFPTTIDDLEKYVKDKIVSTTAFYEKWNKEHPSEPINFNFTYSKITMGNTIGYAGRYKFLDSDQDNTEIFTQNSENLIRILYDSSNNRGVEIIQKILSTFRFLEYSTDNLNCEENSKYFVISRENYGVSDFLVKSKTDSEQAISCSYIVEEDFELKDMDATYFLALTDNFLILDRGTAPPPRALIVYDLGSRKEVYTDEYSSYPPGSVSVLNDTITYWSPIDEKVTNDNCPELNEFLDTGLGVGIEAYVTLNLSDLTKEKLGEYRCSPRQ